MVKECLRHEVLRGTSHLPGLKLPKLYLGTWLDMLLRHYLFSNDWAARWLVESYGRWEFLQMLETLASDQLFHLNFEYFDVISMVNKRTEHGKLLFIC